MHLWLIGMMGSGKTTIGRRTARKLKWEFMDLDATIEKNEGKPVAEIFRDSGEPAFRRLEAAAVARAAKGSAPSVIATGGGAVLSPENVKAMRRSGRVVWLRASPHELSRRLAASAAARPLLSEATSPRERELRLGTLLKMREARYRGAADVVLDTGRLSLPQAAERVAALARSKGADERVVVRTPNGRYDVRIGDGLLARAGSIVRSAVGGAKAFLVTDTNVAPLFADSLEASLEAAGYSVARLVLPAGERHKSLAGAQKIWRFLFANGVDRKSPVVCLGGGVVGDLAGFAAATALRGVPVVQIPTTLVSQVDSSVGGKTAIDVAEGKNLVGAFHWPSSVIVDVALLSTLPRRELVSGIGEVVKYGAIADAALFALLERSGAALLDDPRALATVVRRCIEIKASVVARDPRETGYRGILNFGHTVGHAFEAASGLRMRHGEAVAAGMAVEADLAVSLGRCAARDRDRLVSLLEAFGLPTDGPRREAVRFLRADKKRAGESVRMPVLLRAGRVSLQDIPLAMLERHLQG
ncbi:MAG TPA: 3-dehydroquinate synthase [bacterium]|nr:3-dehydroquinate synthase [bacterium]